MNFTALLMKYQVTPANNVFQVVLFLVFPKKRKNYIGPQVIFKAKWSEVSTSEIEIGCNVLG